MIVGYARISDRDLNPESQMDALTSAGCERIFVEKITGANRDRPQLKAALDQAGPGDVLVVWKLDRLARSVRQLAETVEQLQSKEISLKVLTQQICTSTFDEVRFFQFVSAIAEFERELMLERTQRGLATARRANRRGGRPKALDENQIKQAKLMLADPMLTVEEVAKEMGVQVSTLYRHIPGGRSSISRQAA